MCYGRVHDVFAEDIPGSKLHVRASWLAPLAQFQDLEEPLFQHLKSGCEEESPEKGCRTLSVKADGCEVLITLMIAKCCMIPIMRPTKHACMHTRTTCSINFGDMHFKAKQLCE